MAVISPACSEWHKLTPFADSDEGPFCAEAISQGKNCARPASPWWRRCNFSPVQLVPAILAIMQQRCSLFAQVHPFRQPRLDDAPGSTPTLQKSVAGSMTLYWS